MFVLNQGTLSGRNDTADITIEARLEIEYATTKMKYKLSNNNKK